jgi:ribosomal protein S10
MKHFTVFRLLVKEMSKRNKWRISFHKRNFAKNFVVKGRDTEKKFKTIQYVS